MSLAAAGDAERFDAASRQMYDELRRKLPDPRDRGEGGARDRPRRDPVLGLAATGGGNTVRLRRLWLYCWSPAMAVARPRAAVQASPCRPCS
jgi:hypothetical protein